MVSKKNALDILGEACDQRECVAKSGSMRRNYRKPEAQANEVLGLVIRDGKLGNECVTGRIQGRRGRGRPRLQYMNTLARSVGGGLGLVEFLQMANSRTQWRRMVDNVPRIRHFGKVMNNFFQMS